MVDEEGRVQASRGGLRSVLGEDLPSRSRSLRNQWCVYDHDERPLSPEHWPAARALRGEKVMPGLLAIHSPPRGVSRRMRVSAIPVSGGESDARIIVLVEDAEPEQDALDRMRSRIEQRFSDIVLAAVQNAMVALAKGQGDLAGISTAGLSLDLSPASRLSDLSPREEDVIRLIAWGYSQKEIAAKLGIAVKTVEFHRTGAVRKIGATSRAEIVRYAVRRDWMRSES